MKQIFDFEKLIEGLISNPAPIWRVVSSRQLSKLLGVSLQSLANWRVRETGPTPVPKRKGKGNRIFYRPDNVAAWLSGQAGRPQEPWEFVRDWLSQREIEMSVPSKEAIDWMVAQLDPML